jgi:hypothetical protein
VKKAKKTKHKRATKQKEKIQQNKAQKGQQMHP